MLSWQSILRIGCQTERLAQLRAFAIIGVILLQRRSRITMPPCEYFTLFYIQCGVYTEFGIEPRIWQVHPFREGNTHTVVMMMTFFVEQHGYFMDQELLAASAGYVRDSFVMASLDQLSEYEHLERILLDAVQSAPIHYDVETLCNSISPSSDRYSKYQREPYKPLPHYKRET